MPTVHVGNFMAEYPCEFFFFVHPFQQPCVYKNMTGRGCKGIIHIFFNHIKVVTKWLFGKRGQNPFSDLVHIGNDNRIVNNFELFKYHLQHLAGQLLFLFDGYAKSNLRNNVTDNKKGGNHNGNDVFSRAHIFLTSTLFRAKIGIVASAGRNVGN